MNNAIKELTLGVLDAVGAKVTPAGAESYKVVAKSDPASAVAWLLGAENSTTAVTFDPKAATPGSGFIYVGTGSIVSQKIAQYADAKGICAQITIEQSDANPNAQYQPYLFCRFVLRSQGPYAMYEIRWKGISLVTGATVKITGDPLNGPSVHEGNPPEDRCAPIQIPPLEAATRLIDQWEADAAVRGDALHKKAGDDYMKLAKETISVLHGEELQAHLEILEKLYKQTMETSLEAAVMVWK